MNNPTQPDSVKPASAFLLFGQRFVIDSYITDDVVFDRIKYNNVSIIGMYKKPKEDSLFVANVNGIAKITSYSTEWLVHKSIKQALTYLPLQIGNKWVCGFILLGGAYEPDAHPFSND